MTHEEPAQLGRYRILGELGRGAMGVVYLAEDPALKRGVAIKVVMGGAAAREEALARFQREAECGARILHPNIVSIFDVGEDPHFGPYLAMEHVDGSPLHELIQRGPLPAAQVADMAAQGALALETAHRAGILHRDIKPANFMLAQDGALKLMDFGIARPSEVMQATALFCTPAYASPDLLKGHPPCEADDRWAFAVTLFQCLTGDVPFQGTSVAGTLSAISLDPPSFPGDFDAALIPVFTKALAKDPAERYPDLRSMVQDFIRAVDMESLERVRILARLGVHESVSQAPTLRMRHLPWRWIGTGAAAVALVILGVALWPAAKRPLTVVSNPPGAEVKIDGHSIGTTPIEDRAIPVKSRRIFVFLPDHVSVDRPLDRRERTVSVTLEPLPWQASVISEPVGAEIWLDGARQGRTPLKTLQVPGAGQHRLELRLPGHQTWSMVISRSRKPPAVIRMEPAPKASKGPRSLSDRVRDFFRKK